MRMPISADIAQWAARVSYDDLPPDVPLDREPSANTIGRYYDAFPLNAKDKPDLLVSWADGPVESGVLGSAGLPALSGFVGDRYVFSVVENGYPVKLKAAMRTQDAFAETLARATKSSP